METGRGTASWSPDDLLVGSTDHLESVETHTATLFFADDRVYKLKKPVDLGFLDFTTPEKRHIARLREACRTTR